MQISERESGRSPVRKGLSFLVEQMDRFGGEPSLTLRRESVSFRRLPQEFEGYRLVQVSDLHSRLFGENQDQLLQAICELRPDGIFLTGDLLHRNYDREEKKRLRPFLENVVRLAPVYAVEGNHESRSPSGWELMLDMKAAGITVLMDRGICLYREGARIGIAGLSARPNSELRRKKEPDITVLERGRRALKLFSPGDFVILLAHCPEDFEAYQQLGASLVLSGHAHGGLMRLPGGRALLAPGQGWLPRYTRGLYAGLGTVMEVSAGLGGPRIGIPPELVCLELHRKA